MGATTDPTGKRVFVSLVDAALEGPGGGFTAFLWPKPGLSEPVDKLCHARKFAPWDWVLFTGLYVDDVDAAFHAALWQWLGMVALLGGVSTLIMWLVLRSVRNTLGGELEQAVGIAQDIAQGNLATRVPVNGDKRASLMASLETMRAGLVKTVSNVRVGAENINTGVNEIATGNTDLSQRTEQQAAALVQTASSIGEMTENVKRNADSAETAAHLATEAADVAKRGSSVVGEVVQTMGEITRSSDQIRSAASSV